MLHRSVAIFLLQLMLIVFAASPALAEEKLPSGVTSRLKKVEAYMVNVEKSLAQGKVNKADLDRARSVLSEIEKQYPANATSAAVVAARERVDAGAAATEALKSGGTPGPVAVDAAKLPSTVTSRLKQIDSYMGSVESSLAQNRANLNDLERAQGALAEIRDKYPANRSAPEVLAAEDRVAKGAAAIGKLELEKASSAQDKVAAEKAAEARAEEWADRLALYGAGTQGGKGDFGLPSADGKALATLKAQYEDAKAVYAEFLLTGIDKDSHWRLRQAEYDIRSSIESYEASTSRICEAAVAAVKGAAEELAKQVNAEQPSALSSDRLEDIRRGAAEARMLLPSGSGSLDALNFDMAELERLQAEVGKLVLAKRKMKPNLFKGNEAPAIRGVAEALVLKEQPKAAIERVHITSADWAIEDVTEWTDNTKSALQHRVTKRVTVQAVTLAMDEVTLYTLFIHIDTIAGIARAMTGHVVAKEDFLRENLPAI